MPKAVLVKPFGGENWLVLTEPEEFQTFVEKLTPGDEFMLRCHELSDEEFEGLENFGGFDGAPVAPEEATPEEEVEEPEGEPAAPPAPPQE